MVATAVQQQAASHPVFELGKNLIKIVPVSITGFDDWAEAETTLNAIEGQGYFFNGGFIRELNRDGMGRTMLYAEMIKAQKPDMGQLVVRQWMAEAADDQQWREEALRDIAALEAQGFRIVKRWRKSAGRGRDKFPALQVIMRKAVR